MRTECVTKVWEFYRDNCDGYKEPMRKQLRELDEHVDHIAAENAKLREERREYQATIDSLVDECADHKDENEKLRKLVSDMWHELNYTSVRAENGTNHCLDHMAAFDDRMEDLGIEVEE